MRKLIFSFKKKFIEHKLLFTSIVLSLFMAGTLQWSFFRYLVGILSCIMIILDYKDGLSYFSKNKKLIYKKYIKNIFFLIESLVIGFIINEIFWIFTKNRIFILKEGIFKSTLITTISIIVIINLISVLFLENLGFDKTKWIDMILALFFMNSNVINGTINSLYIIKSKTILNFILTLTIVSIIFYTGYYMFKIFVLKGINFKH